MNVLNDIKATLEEAGARAWASVMSALEPTPIQAPEVPEGLADMPVPKRAGLIIHYQIRLLERCLAPNGGFRNLLKLGVLAVIGTVAFLVFGVLPLGSFSVFVLALVDMIFTVVWKLALPLVLFALLWKYVIRPCLEGLGVDFRDTAHMLERSAREEHHTSGPNVTGGNETKAEPQ